MNQGSQKQEPSRTFHRLENINEIDLSELVKLAISSKVHSERLSQKGWSDIATRIISTYHEDVRSFGLDPYVIEKRIIDENTYEQIRKSIANYILETQAEKGISKSQIKI